MHTATSHSHRGSKSSTRDICQRAITGLIHVDAEPRLTFVTLPAPGH